MPNQQRDTSRTVQLSRAVLAGSLASLAMFLAFGVAFGAASALGALLPVDRPGLATLGGWLRALTSNVLLDLARPNLFAALALFATGGIAWALLYASVFRPRLNVPEWHQGLRFALVPWLFSLLVFLPLVGGGLFGLSLGAGPLPILGNLLLHVVYGEVLCELYGPLGAAVHRERRAPTEAEQRALLRCESWAAMGLATGLVLGNVAGGAALLLMRAADGAPLLGVNPFGTLLAVTLSGGSAGALVGSFLGLLAAGPQPEVQLAEAIQYQPRQE